MNDRNFYGYGYIPSIFSFIEKKQRFAISNTGEFIDNVYEELETSSVISAILGRKGVSFQYSTRVFYAADVVLEGYLYKRGHWFRNWKKRYFILRKDIRALCYYESKECLKLLGNVKLSTDSSVEYSAGETILLDGFRHVLAVQEDSRYSTTNTIYIRADTENAILYWQHEIANEACNNNDLKPGKRNDWWSELIKNTIESVGESTKTKRDAIVDHSRPTSKPVTSNDKDNSNITANRGESIGESFEPIVLLASSTIIESANDNSHPDENTDDEDDEVDKSSTKSISIHRNTSQTNIFPFQSGSISTDTNEDGVNEKDRLLSTSVSTTNEELNVSRNASTSSISTTVLSTSPQINNTIARSSIVQDVTKMFQRISVTSFDTTIKKKSFVDKKDKSFGPCPFQDPLVTKFELHDGSSLAGFQLSFIIRNICFSNDRLFAVIYYMLNNESHKQWKQSSITEIKTITDKSMEEVKIHFHVLQPIPNNNTKNIMIRLFRIDDTSSTSTSMIRDNITKYNTSHYIQLAEMRTTYNFLKKNPIFRMNMKITIDLPVDLSTVGEGINRNITLGVIKLSSASLYQHRQIFNQLINFYCDNEIDNKLKSNVDNKIENKKMESLPGLIKPYAEAMFSLITTTGQTLSLEQLYVSSYAIGIAESFIKFAQLERLPSLLQVYKQLMAKEKAITIDILNETTGRTPSDDRIVERKLNSSGDSKIDSRTDSNLESRTDSKGESNKISALSNKSDSLKQCIDIIENLIVSIRDDFIKTIETCINSRNNYMNNKLESMTDRKEIIVDNNDNNNNKDNRTDSQSFDISTLSMLRRSVYKKTSQWQYVATNLNIHLFTSRHYEFHEIMNINTNDETDNRINSLDKKMYANLNNKNKLKIDNFDKKQSNLHVIPSITLGCPAAHDLKFSDGGLRRLFQHLTYEKRLIWLHLLQSNISIDIMNKYIDKYPKESNVFFGALNSLHDNNLIDHEINTVIRNVQIYKRKYEIAKRIDICSSQILAYAVTSIKTILSLATQIGGIYLDILQRSLRIGFLLNLQSFLSTSGDELGMLEDCDIATTWLSLVTLRFVSYDKNDNCINLSKETTISDNYVAIGTSPGTSIRRDKVGRFIVDMDVSDEESYAISKALEFLKDCEIPIERHSNKSNNSFSSTNKVIDDEIDLQLKKAVMFSKDVIVEYTNHEKRPIVHAVAELHGILFTQGINEMQTFANISQSRDISRQTEINYMSMNRLSDYYYKYKILLEYQLRIANNISNQIYSNQKDNNILSRSPSIKISRTLSKSMKRTININPGYSSEVLDIPTLNEDFDDSNSIDSNDILRDSYYRMSLINQSMSKPKDVKTNNIYDLLSIKVMNNSDRLFHESLSAILRASKSPYEKHVDVFMKTSALCRKISGIAGILCKSGKDRTSMAVSLDISRSLVEELGVLNGYETCQLLRSNGVRCMNVYANTGQSKYAFNNIQKMSLPVCFRPPHGTNSSSVLS